MTAPTNSANIGSSRCDYTWPGHRMRSHDRGRPITLIGAHRCILAPGHPPGCLCDCGATTGLEALITAALDGEWTQPGLPTVQPPPSSYQTLEHATDGVLLSVVRLHAPIWDVHRYVCRGCDADGYGWEPPQWPCSTVELIADELVVDLRHCGATNEKGDNHD